LCTSRPRTTHGSCSWRSFARAGSPPPRSVVALRLSGSRARFERGSSKKRRPPLGVRNGVLLLRNAALCA
jgi:hypothetical protein